MWSITDVLTYFILTLILGLVTAVCWARNAAAYWKRQNIPHIQGLPFIGNFKDIMTFKKCIADQLYDYYFDEQVRDTAAFGINVFHKPAIIIRDPELIKRILVKDFNSFPDRYAHSDIHSDILGSTNLFFVRNPLWRTIRTKLTPFFSSGKLKQMFSLVNDIGSELDATLRLQKLNENTKLFCIEIKDYVSRYTTDVIASCAFGVRANSLQDPQSDFKRNGKKLFDFNLRRAIELTSIFFVPELVPIFKFKTFTKSASEFLRNSIQHVMAEREATGVPRNDLIDTFISIKNANKNSEVSYNTDIAFEGDVFVAQAGAFFTAGFETSSSVLSFGLYELAKHLDMQKRLREEIRETLLKHNGELTYDSVMNMEYLNMVFMETLRLYPPLPFLDRRSIETNGYSLEPFLNYKIPKEMMVIIPAFALHRDPQYFPNPDEFNPERFSKENRDNIIPYTYMPFGLGPHNCIGERFGVLQSKVGFVNFLRNHFVLPSDAMPKEMQLNKKALVLQSEGGTYLQITRDPLLGTTNGLNGIIG